MPILEALGGAAGAGSLLSGIGSIFGGLFGKKKKAPTPYDNILSQAQGARAAAEKYGFNPLTMLQYGNPAGAMGGGDAPLASIDLILGGIETLADEFSGEAAQKRQADKLALDLAQIELDKARSGVSLSDAGTGPQTLGQRPATVGTINETRPDFRFPQLTMGGEKYGTDPGTSDAGAIEERYGDFLGSLYGVGVAVGDWHHNLDDRTKFGLGTKKISMDTFGPMVEGELEQKKKDRQKRRDDYKARRDNPERERFMRQFYPTYLD